MAPSTWASRQPLAHRFPNSPPSGAELLLDVKAPETVLASKLTRQSETVSTSGGAYLGESGVHLPGDTAGKVLPKK